MTNTDINTTAFTSEQKMKIIFSYVRKELWGSIFPKASKIRGFSLQTRGNVFQRLGGTITEKDHEKMLDDEFSK